MVRRIIPLRIVICAALIQTQGRGMARRKLRDDQWTHIKDLLPGKSSDPGRTATDNRKFVDAVLWIARTGAHWRELPESFGAWNSVFQRYNRWSNAGVWERVFRALSGGPDCEYVMIDSSTPRAQKGGSRSGSPWPFEERADPPQSTRLLMGLAIRSASS